MIWPKVHIQQGGNYHLPATRSSDIHHLGVTNETTIFPRSHRRLRYQISFQMRSLLALNAVSNSRVTNVFCSTSLLHNIHLTLGVNDPDLTWHDVLNNPIAPSAEERVPRDGTFAETCRRRTERVRWSRIESSNGAAAGESESQQS